MGKDGISVDSLYQELQSQYPELFPEDITHPADELIAIASALNQTEPQVKNPYHADMDESPIYSVRILCRHILTLEVPEPHSA